MIDRGSHEADLPTASGRPDSLTDVSTNLAQLDKNQHESASSSMRRRHGQLLTQPAALQVGA